MCNSELLKNYSGEVLVIRRTKDEIMNIGNIYILTVTVPKLLFIFKNGIRYSIQD